MYLLFVSHECGEHCNTIFPTSLEVHDELRELAKIIADDGYKPERIHSRTNIELAASKGECYYEFADGTWYSVYKLNEFEVQRIKEYLNGQNN